MVAYVCGGTRLTESLFAAMAAPRPIKVGDKVMIEPSGLGGVVKFQGPTKFAKGRWVGIQLDKQGMCSTLDVYARVYPLLCFVALPLRVFGFF